MDWMSFFTIIVFVFAIVVVIAGIFSAAFGSGKSRMMGAVLIAIGLILGVVWAYLVGWSDVALFNEVYARQLLVDAFVNLIAVAIGALAAVGLFLVVVMKS